MFGTNVLVIAPRSCVYSWWLSNLLTFGLKPCDLWPLPCQQSVSGRTISGCVHFIMASWAMSQSCHSSIWAFCWRIIVWSSDPLQLLNNIWTLIFHWTIFEKGPITWYWAWQVRQLCRELEDWKILGTYQAVNSLFPRNYLCNLWMFQPNLLDYRMVLGGTSLEATDCDQGRWLMGRTQPFWNNFRLHPQKRHLYY